MTPPAASETVGVLTSGGLDSSILIAHLHGAGSSVQPFYVRFGLVWEQAELAASRRFLAAIGAPAPVVLSLPLDDLYAGHWSLTGQQVPDAASPDEAVFLPGRNALLLVKTALYCQLHGIGRLVLAPLGTSPFADAKPTFIEPFMAALNGGIERPVRVELPFQSLSKREVMQLGRDLPLELTFSCLQPVDARHCGRCNKCAERQAAFRLIDLPDPTRYVSVPSPTAAQ